MIAIREHLRLLRQERTPGVNHVNARQSVLPRHFLDTCAKTLILFVIIHDERRAKTSADHARHLRGNLERIDIQTSTQRDLYLRRDLITWQVIACSLISQDSIRGHQLPALCDALQLEMSMRCRLSTRFAFVPSAFCAPFFFLPGPENLEKRSNFVWNVEC